MNIGYPISTISHFKIDGGCRNERKESMQILQKDIHA